MSGERVVPDVLAAVDLGSKYGQGERHDMRIERWRKIKRGKN